MADVFPVEGRDFMLGIFPKNGANAANTYLGLFTGGDGTTVPAATDTLAALDAPFAEAGGSWGYQRVAVPAADWGNPADSTIWGVVTRAVAAAQKSFAAATAAYATPITGFFLASAQNAGVAIYYSNFDDQTPIASLALGDIIRVTPRIGLGA